MRTTLLDAGALGAARAGPAHRVAPRPAAGFDPRRFDPSTPVLLLGGGGNAVSVARNLGRLGVSVAASGNREAWGLASRHCRRRFTVPPGKEEAEYWRELLLSPGPGPLDGHVIFALCDASIAFVCEHRTRLAGRYILEDFDAGLRAAMLDKKATLEMARAAGVPTPDFWTVRTREDVAALRGRLRFPVMVKPIHSHLFIPVFGRKLFIVESDFDEVVEKTDLAFAHGVEVMVTEMIPGPDDLLSSYYTYIDDAGRSLFHYTKSVIRRFPVNRGGACYHRSEWLPETAELGRKFFDGIGWRGMGNIEFKRDARDGKLKVIEVNPRFTAAHRLVVAAGVPIDLIIYCHLTGQPGPEVTGYDQRMRMLNPLRDALAFVEMRRRGEIGLGGWLKSWLQGGRKVMPLFSLGDPMPSVIRLKQEGARALRRLARR